MSKIESENLEASAAASGSETMSVRGETTSAQTSRHQPPLYAESIAKIGSFTITNSLINSWLAVLIIAVAAIFIRRKLTNIPKGIQNYLEVLWEKGLELADLVTSERKKSLKFLPIILPLFLFILFNNWLGLLPGVGSIGFYEIHAGSKVFIPMLRGATADLNTTLALAIMAVILTHVFGVGLTSFWQHLNRFVGLKLFFDLPKKIFKEKDFMAIFVQPIKFLVGLIEIVSELSKLASLSFRLFGNVFAGEVLLAVISTIFVYGLPIPFMFLELMVGLIQAFIFSVLTLVFLTVMATSHETEHG